MRNTRKQVAKTSRRRANLTRKQFLLQMQLDVSLPAASFLWETILPYLEPHLTPHPEDDIVEDLPVHADDMSLDWPQLWARQQGFHESNLPDWPDGWPVTIRNYGRWLDLGPDG